MIVKDESHIIGLTLENLVEKIHFDYWVICDTGSSDNTIQIIKDFFKEKNIPGELHEVPWKDFAYNRTKAMQLAYNKTDYLLMFDADDQIEGNFVMPVLKSDSYKVQFMSDSRTMVHSRDQFFNNRKKWKYEGVLHEYAVCLEETNGIGFIPGDYHFIGRSVGNRSKDPRKYAKDAEILEKAFEEAYEKKDPIFHRYAFYCANSHNNCGQKEQALKWYKKVLSIENWHGEKYISCQSIYDIYEELKEPELGLYALVESIKYDKDRVECIYRLVLYYMLHDMNDMAFTYYQKIQDYYENKYANNLDNISNKLFSQTTIYNFLLPYYMIILADKIKNKKVGVKMYEIIFNYQHVHGHWWLHNIFHNLQFFADNLPYDNMQFYNNMIKYIDACKKNDFVMKPETEIEINKIINKFNKLQKTNDVVIAILAKDKEYCLPIYLSCLLNQTFPKKNIHLYIRTNDNKDNTCAILDDFVNKYSTEYASIHYDKSNISNKLKEYKEHEWNSDRFSILGQIRQESINYSIKLNAHYFVIDCDNFITPNTLESMVLNKELGVIAPMLETTTKYSNYHYDIDQNGYLKNHPMYEELLYRKVVGLTSVKVVHCTYFINNNILPKVSYNDNSRRYEYVIFSDVLRKNNIPQYLDNRTFYGFLVLSENIQEYNEAITYWKNHNIGKQLIPLKIQSEIHQEISEINTDHISIFTNIYENKVWGNNNNELYNGSSGNGSNLEINIPYISFLQKFITDKKIYSISDLGCGDFLIGNKIYDNLDITYYGYDAYEKIINHHKKQQKNPKYHFTHLDFLNKKEELIPSDLCIIKDVLQHWNSNEITVFLDYLINNKIFKNILIINCNAHKENNIVKNNIINIKTGEYRALSATKEPLNKYNSSIIFNYGPYNSKEVSLITL